MSNDQLGQSILEVVVAATVGILVVAALVFATLFSLRDANFAKASAQATKLAQEGMEMVRTSRDRDGRIGNLTGTANCPVSGNPVCSWNGDASCSSIWSCQLYNSYGSGGNAYFRFNSSASVNLDYLTTRSDMPSSAEDLLNGKFKRVIILSDDSTSYATQKTITVIVQWSDTTGIHESRLITILRKL
ncbi:MAG: hypothetical protein M1142_05165 [Patescibacteria group bacterium]|nr:hypothetical protein [Patescibacteria group bacterium]